MFGKKKPRPEYDDDFFASTRMSFGDHIEELRTRMWRAIKGLLFFLVVGFILDGIGDATGQPMIGLGKPMLKVITEPVASQVKEFYRRRTDAIREKMEDDRKNGSTNERFNKTVDVRAKLPAQAFMNTFEGLKLKDSDADPAMTLIEVKMTLHAAELYVATDEGQYQADAQRVLTGLGIMEAFWVYMKVSLLCGFVVGCPYIFYQFWAFVGAGLYPHEKKLVHVYMPFSIVLFLIGVFVCQFIVMPKAVSAMLGFYRWIDVDPDLRLNEWLGFALLMPLVFGISFQTPLVMLFFNRLGMLTYKDYLTRWRYALFGLAIMSAVLTPSTDIISMLWLFVPTFGLYMLGTFICYILPPPEPLFGPPEEEEVGV